VTTLSLTRHPRVFLTLLTLALLVPFLGKAFHMDDTVFLWCAEQILREPLDFYGFSANWSDSPYPMHIINQNPPLIAYYIALVAALFGWSEWVLHTAFLLPAVGFVLGTYSVARHFCSSPVAATLPALVSPAFIVSSTNVMAEVTMAALYVTAAAAWLHGLKTGLHRYLALSALLISLSAMTKYFGITMVPLLLVFTCLQREKPRYWYLYLLAPVAVVVAYQWLTLHLYGSNLLLRATSYSVSLGINSESSTLRRLATGLSFLGGCTLSVLLLAPKLWQTRTLLLYAAGLALLSGLLLSVDLNGHFLAFRGERQWTVVVQYALFAVLGVQVIALTLSDLNHHRDDRAVLLALWVLGTLTFASLVNWSTNARTLLPLTPVVGILIVRRLELHHPGFSVARPWYALPMAMVAAVSLLVAFADQSWANNQQLAARKLAMDLGKYPHRVWFGGHWGFQWYMEKYGALTLVKDSPIEPGDLVIKPDNNSNPIPLNERDFTRVEVKSLPICCRLRTMSATTRAGFYSDFYGELPFTFAPPQQDEFEIYIAGRFATPDEAQAYYHYSRDGAQQAAE
jgi:4-amino-4-deoxy-L-arabinose transferase-like glycosyltransferase